ncbi:hypothetical protein [Pseudokineococcus lusitanus]|uniref:hypothetical protein n=1 Tax=Pseudokineococcus lusitanus TaxID=763993 RepID=UPI000F4A6D2B|nr:hypothetical protein [Pseudokineococcus lusitanus]
MVLKRISDAMPKWAQTMEPRPIWAHSKEGEVWAQGVEGGEENCKIEARWWVYEGEVVSDSPRQLVITVSEDASAGVRGRGVTAGLMRQVERVLSQWVRDTHWGDETGVATTMEERARALAQRHLQGMPSSPRVDGTTYYSKLLGAVVALDDLGYENSNRLIAELLGKSRETIKTQLRVARRGGAS